MLRLATAQHPGLATTASSPRSIELRRDDFDSMQAMLRAFQFALRSADPDVLLTQGATNGCFHGWLNRQNFTALRSKSVARLRISHGQPTIAQSVLTVKQGIAMELFSWRDVCIRTFETASLSRKVALQVV